MNGSLEAAPAPRRDPEEEALFEAALQALAAGDLAGARHWFEAVVALAGRRQEEARRQLAEIARREGAAPPPPPPPAPAPREVLEKEGQGSHYDDGWGAGAPPPGIDRGDATWGAPDAGDDFPEPPPPADADDLFESVRRSPRLRSFTSGTDTAPQAEAPAPATAAAAATLRRTPHLGWTPDGPPAPSAALAVSVWADTGPFLAGERGEEIVVEYAPPELRLDAWLVASEHFAIEGPAVQPLVLRQAEARSAEARFAVRVRPLSDLPAGPTGASGAFLSALFAYRGRPCGRVTRTVELALPRPAATAGAAPTLGAAPAATPSPSPAATASASLPAAPPPDGLRVEVTAEPADLVVRIVAASLSDGRLFECRVQTRLLPAYADGGGAGESWRLPEMAADLVAAYMADFTAKGASDQVRAFALRGAGISLFEASPKLFQKVFWELVDAGTLPRTIAIVSEEPYVPWELMVPSRTLPSGDEQDREPLGVEFLVSRWSARDHVLPAQRVRLADCWVVAPTDSKLDEAAAEAQMVIDRFAPGMGALIDPADVVHLDQTLAGAGRTLLHFVCHGQSGGAAGQTLLLQNKEKLKSSFLRAMPGVKKGFRAARPLVFLNACEVGRAEPALAGVGGFADAFMTLGASAVVAPLWSVKDSIAHQVAVEFYERSRREPQTPFAEILRDLRRRSYGPAGGEDSWAAYCFYGDPLATGA
jgi:hypothetical protein